MTTSLKKMPDSQVEVVVDLDKDDLRTYWRETEKILTNQLRLDGFRSGKVPPNIARRHVGEEKTRQDALTLALQSSLADTIKKEKLEVIDQKSLVIKENSPEKLVYKITLTVFPEVVLGKYTNLAVKIKPVAVQDREVERVVYDILKLRTIRAESKDPAKKGDRVEVDFSLMLNGTVIDGGKSENHPIILGDNKFAPGFEEAIVGMKAGETKKFSLSIPADYYQTTIAGKELAVEVFLKKVENIQLPELNDDFVKSLGRFNSVENLRANIKQGLLAEKETKEKDRVRIEILNNIIKHSRIEVPKILIEQRLDSLIQDFDNELHQKGMELGPYLAHLNKTQDDLRNDWHAKAESQVEMSLVAREIAKKEKIQVNDGEIAQEFSVMADHYNQRGLNDALKEIDPAAIKIRIHDVLVNEKVFDFLEKNNVVD